MRQNKGVDFGATPMAADQERWNQAQQNTTNVMRGTQPHIAVGQAQKTTANAMRGTYTSDQAAHDKAYNQARQGYMQNNPGKKFTPSGDVAVSQGLLKQGADPKKLENSVAAHSPNAARHAQTDRGKYGRDVVAVAADRNRKDDPRADRENIKPGHEPRRGGDTPNQNAQYGQAKATGHNAAYGVSEHSRNSQIAAYGNGNGFGR